MPSFSIAFLLLTLIGCSTVPKVVVAPTPYRPCVTDPNRQANESAELQKIVADDQADRKNFLNLSQEEMMAVAQRDVERRQRVGQIFGEGCFKTAADYAAAALVFQHGDSPDHYLQSFMWSKRSIELGDESQKSLMALSLDRYLVNTGHKQLFASQANATNIGDTESCYCLQQVEHSFSDDLRKAYTGRSRLDAFEWLKTLNRGKACPNTECSEPLAATPKGSVPGFW